MSEDQAEATPEQAVTTETPVTPYAVPESTPPATVAPPSPKRRRWAPLSIAAVVALLALGGVFWAGTAAVDPTQSDEYASLKSSDEAAQASVENDLVLERRDTSRARASAFAAESSAAAVQSSAAAAATSAYLAAVALNARESQVAAREQAVAVAEQQIAATSIKEGTYTVGRDVEPGTYRTEQAVGDFCYWSITRSGSNGGDIIQNDIVQGGFPTVTLSVGQDFTTNRCGTWIKA